jgi:signal transduction histidine kinase
VRLRRLPVRLRLVVGFAGAMVVVLAAAGAFVFWRVQYALDHRLGQDLRSQTSDLREAARNLPPRVALASLRDQTREAQLLRADGTVLASGPGIPSGQPLITAEQARRASRTDVETGRGELFSKPGKHLRILAVPVHGTGPASVAVTAVRLDQRDEALRELLAQLAVANLIALAVASFVGYRLAHAALDPVERYRAQAEQITHGATGVRLDVPPEPQDELTRLGATLNTMIEALERSAERQQQFIDDASHELRTPLATLSAEIDLALRKPRTAEEHEATLRRLAADTAAVVALADTLMTLGALGSATPNAKDVPAAAALRAAARRARGQLDEQSGRTVDVRVADDLVIHADEALLERALGNIVDNAVRHGAGTITLSASTGAESPAALIAVHDDGDMGSRLPAPRSRTVPPGRELAHRHRSRPRTLARGRNRNRARRSAPPLLRRPAPPPALTRRRPRESRVRSLPPRDDDHPAAPTMGVVAPA